MTETAVSARETTTYPRVKGHGQRRRKHAHNTSITTNNGVEEQYESAALDDAKLESGKARKLRGWGRHGKLGGWDSWKEIAALWL